MLNSTADQVCTSACVRKLIKEGKIEPDKCTSAAFPPGEKAAYHILNLSFTMEEAVRWYWAQYGVLFQEEYQLCLGELLTLNY